MFAFIRGKIASLRLNEVILEVGGIGYKIAIPLSYTSRMGSVGSDLCLHTSFVIGEDKAMLYGFLEVYEKDLFEMFFSLSGIGPKTALALVGHLVVGEIKQAVAAKNALPFTKVPGIGRKTAEKLILELEGKIDKIEIPFVEKSKPTMAKDAIGALIHLGHSQKTAENMVQKALEKLPKESDLSLLITTALQFR